MTAEQPYCCHLGPNGEECGRPPTHEVFGPDGYEDTAQTCGIHLAEMTPDGGKAEPI